MEGTICVWSIPEKKKENTLTLSGHQFISGVFTPTYKYLYISETSGKIWVKIVFYLIKIINKYIFNM